MQSHKFLNLINQDEKKGLLSISQPFFILLSYKQTMTINIKIFNVFIVIIVIIVLTMYNVVKEGKYQFSKRRNFIYGKYL